VDQTSIKTLYVFVEIGIDSKHLEQTIRTNFPDDRETLRRNLLQNEEDRAQIPTGNKIGVARNLLIEDGKLSNASVSEISLSKSAPTRLALVSTIQFVAALHRLKEDLSRLADNKDSSSIGTLVLGDYAQRTIPGWTGRYEVTIPRSKPLSPGEILGCTAPRLNDVDALMYVCSNSYQREDLRCQLSWGWTISSRVDHDSQP